MLCIQHGNIFSTDNYSLAVEVNSEIDVQIEGDSIDAENGIMSLFFNGECDATSAEVLLGRIYLHITDDTISIDDITNNMFKLNMSSDYYLGIVTDEAPDGEYTNESNMYMVERFTEIPTVESISISNNPTLGKDYIIDTEVDLTGVTLTATYTDGSTKEIPSDIPMSDVTITTGEKEGAYADLDNPITFTYEDCSVDLTVDVVDIIDKIEFYDKNNVINNTDFYDGCDIPKSELYIKTTTKSGVEAELPLSDSRINLDSDVADVSKILNPYYNAVEGDYAGIQTIEITYADTYVTKTTTFDIMVNDKVATINISTTNPPVSSFTVGDTFTKSGAIEVIGESGYNYGDISMSSDNITVTEEDGSKVDLSSPATDKVLKVSFAGKETTYKINVKNTVQAIKVNSLTIELNYSEAIKATDFTGVTVTEIMADKTDGATVDLDFAWIDTSTFDGEITTTQYLKVNYPYNNTTIEGEIAVRVKDELLGITIDNFVDEYEYGDDLDYTGAEFSAKYVSGTYGPYEFGEGDLEVSNFDSSVITDSQTLEFTYDDGIDTASTTITIKIGKATPTYTAPSGLKATYGDTLASVTLPDGFDWQDANTTPVGNVKDVNTFKVTYTPDDTTLYKPVSDIEVTIAVEKADPTYTAPTDLKAGFGDTLADVTLPAGFAWEEDLTTEVGPKGIQTHTVKYTPSDTDNYNILTGIVVSIEVESATPKYTIPSGLTAKYGDTLADVTLPTDANGVFSWEEADTTPVGDAGERVHKVTYTPNDTTNYRTVTGIDVTINVSQLDSTFTIPLGLTATYGDTLSSVALPTDANGVFSWEEADTTPVGNAGLRTHKVTYTPNDANYKTVTGIEVSIDVAKANPNYTTPTGLIAGYGDTLADVTLPTGFTWEEPSTTPVGSMGNQTHTVTYTPTDTTNYNTITGINVNIFVDKVTPSYTIPSGLKATYGDTLSSVTLPTGFSWEESGTTLVGNAGTRTHTVTYTPTDTANYRTITGIDVNIDVAKADPIYTVPTDLEGYEGQALSTINISSYTGFSWTDTTKTIPSISTSGDTYNTTMTFTPSDTANYNTVANIPVVVKVNANEVLEIRIKTAPSKTTYYEGQTFDKTGMVVEANYIVGGWTAITGYTIDKTSALTKADTKVTITYEGKTAEQAITVSEEPVTPTPTPDTPTTPDTPVSPTPSTQASPTPTPTPVTPASPKTPTKPTTTTSSGTQATANTTKFTVTFVNYDGTVIKTEEVVKGKSATAPELEGRVGYRFVEWSEDFSSVERDMTIIAKYSEIVKAKVETGGTIVIDKGGELDLSNITITIYDDEGNEIGEIPVTMDMISGFDSEKTGTQEVTVTYIGEDGEEYTTTFKVKVTKPVETLGEKDEANTDDEIKDTLIPAIIGLCITCLLLGLIAVLTKKNVEIYAITPEGKKLVGKERISKKNKTILLNLYKDKLGDANAIELKVNGKTVEKMGNEEIEVKINDGIQKYKVTDTIKINK